MNKYFTAHEVLEQVTGLNSISTLNKWANLIQKECDYEFHYDYIPFNVYSKRGQTTSHRKTRMFTSEEIKKFQEVVHLIPSLGRNQSLMKIFSDKYIIDGLKHSELMPIIFEKVDAELSSKTELIQSQAKKIEILENHYRTMLKQLATLEEKFTSLDQSSGGWFRRKR